MTFRLIYGDFEGTNEIHESATESFEDMIRTLSTSSVDAIDFSHYSKLLVLEMYSVFIWDIEKKSAGPHISNYRCRANVKSVALFHDRGL
jgi:hypothetical protein